MNAQFPYQKFIIVGSARTGSTLLWSYLNSHPNILCLRGVFGSTNKINFGKFYPDLEDECISPELIAFRNSNPIRFIEKYVFKMYSKPYKSVGFKYFYDHDRHLSSKAELLEYFAKHKDIKVIHIKRNNLLAALYSYKRAMAQDKWTTAQIDYKTEIGISECEQYFQYINEMQELFDKKFRNRTFVIVYEELVSNYSKILNDLQVFLGVEVKNLHTQMIKNENKKLSESIYNYAELEIHFKNSEYANNIGS